MPQLSLINASDLISPIVIKELRQALRARTFLAVFFLLPAALAFTTLLSLHLPYIGSYNQQPDSLQFWASVGLPMLIATVPAFVSLRTEIRDRGIELMMLTTLSPWRILLGKWLALAAQYGLMAVVALPFALTRYFTGGRELAADLTILGILLGVCQVVAAAGLALSCLRPTLAQVVRLGVIIVLALPVLSCVVGLAFILLSSLLARVGLAPLNGLLIALLLLSWGAGRIASETERIHLNTDRKAFYWALMATLSAQAASRLSSLILTIVSLYLHRMAFHAFADRTQPAPPLLRPLIPRRWREDAADGDTGVAGLCSALALTALDLVAVLAGFWDWIAGPLTLVLLTLYALLHLLPRRAREPEPEVADAAGA